MSAYKIIDFIVCRGCQGQGINQDLEKQTSTQSKCQFCGGAGHFLIVTNGKEVREMITLAKYQISHQGLKSHHSS